MAGSMSLRFAGVLAILATVGVAEHFYDRDGSIAPVFRGGRSWRPTAFYDATGELVFTHQGAYPSEQDLADEIERYALDG